MVDQRPNGGLLFLYVSKGGRKEGVVTEGFPGLREHNLDEACVSLSMFV
jgi:hypothetical protein